MARRGNRRQIPPAAGARPERGSGATLDAHDERRPARPQHKRPRLKSRKYHRFIACKSIGDRSAIPKRRSDQGEVELSCSANTHPHTALGFRKLWLPAVSRTVSGEHWPTSESLPSVGKRSVFSVNVGRNHRNGGTQQRQGQVGDNGQGRTVFYGAHGGLNDTAQQLRRELQLRYPERLQRIQQGGGLLAVQLSQPRQAFVRQLGGRSEE